MKAALLIAALLYAAPPPAAGAPSDLTEEQAIAAFSESNPALKAARAQVFTARRAHTAAALPANPVFSADRDSLGAGENSFLLEWVPDFSGRKRLLRSAASAGITAAEHTARLTELELRSVVRRAFYSLLLAQEVSLEFREGAARMKALAGVLRSSAADRRGYDRLRLEVEFARAAAEARDAARSEEEARCSLAALLGLEVCGNTRARGTLLPPAAAARAAAAVHPAVERLRAEAAAREAERLAALRRAAPELGLRGGVKTAGNAGSGLLAGVSLSIPFLDSGRPEADLRAAERDAALALMEAGRLKLAIDSGAAALRLAGALESAAAHASGVLPQTERLERAAALAYTEGRLGAPELVDAFRTALQARVRRLEISREARLAEIDLRLAAGE